MLAYLSPPTWLHAPQLCGGPPCFPIPQCTQPSFPACSLSFTPFRRPDDENIDTKIMEAVKARLPPKVDGEEGQAT